MASSKEKSTIDKKKRLFSWTPPMIEDLLSFLHNYKVTMDYKEKDFDVDRAQQYAALRKEMSKKYGKEWFGPEFSDDEGATSQEQKEQKENVKASEALDII